MGTTTSTIPSDFSASFIQDLADSLGIPTTAVYIKAITVVSSQGTEMVVAVEYGIVTLGGKSGDEEVLEAMQDLVYPPTTTTVTLTVPTDGQANTRRLPRPVLMCQGGSTTPNGAFVQACQGYRDRFHAIARMPVGRELRVRDCAVKINWDMKTYRTVFFKQHGWSLNIYGVGIHQSGSDKFIWFDGKAYSNNAP